MWHVVVAVLLVVVMWVVWVINKFMFNLNVDQLAWVTGSAIRLAVLYVFLWIYSPLPPSPTPS